MKTIFLFIFASLCFVSTSGHAQTPWYPYPVEIWDSPFQMTSSRTASDYIPLEKKNKKWNICVSFPHMKDAYWLAVNFGISQEIRRLGSAMELYQAGSYNNLGIQISQIRQCVKDGAEGLIIGAISLDGLNALFTELKKEIDIPVIDLVNGISSPSISAKSMVSFREMGFEAGEYLVKHAQQKKGRTIKVAWFPGPKEAGWVTEGNRGFLEATKDSNIEIITTQYGDTGQGVQTELVNKVLDSYAGQIDYIVGTGVTAEVSVKILRHRELSDQVKIISYYLTPGVYQNILRGSIVASSTDSAVIQGKIAVDQVIRILEGQPYHKHVGPRLHVLDINNIKSFDRKTLLAPSGFHATYTIN
ncbi:MAG: TMAO reductase system periplasmic protein TorT [Desulfotalea sp.]